MQDIPRAQRNFCHYATVERSVTTVSLAPSHCTW